MHEKMLRQDAALMADTVAEWRQHATGLRHMRLVGMKVMRRWLQTGLWRAFSAWAEHALTMLRMKDAGSKVMRRWLQAGVWRSFAKWQEVARTATRLRVVGLRVVGSWLRAGLLQCFRLWDAAVDAAAEERRLAPPNDPSEAAWRMRRCFDKTRR